jgi:hypothetical protein
MNQILQKLTSNDSDIRYMALADINENISNVKELIPVVISLLQDPNGQVQNMALKALHVLSNVSDPEQIFLALLEKDISTFSVKSLLLDLEPFNANSLVPLLTSHLENTEHILDVLDIFNVLYGKHQVEVNNNSTKKFLSLLSAPVAISKRAISVLGIISGLYTNERDVDFIIENILSSASNKVIKVLAFESVAKKNKQALRKTSSLALPLILDCINSDSDEDKEAGFLSLDSFIRMSAFIPNIENIIDISLEYIKYDPNYCDMSDFDEDDHFEDVNSDDDDISWRVRKGSAKTICSIFQTYSPTVTSLFYLKTLTIILSCLKEREEIVKISVLECLLELVNEKHRNLCVHFRKRKSFDQEPRDSQATNLRKNIPLIMSIILPLSTSSNINIRQQSFKIMKELELFDNLKEYHKEIAIVIEKNFEPSTISNHSLKLDVIVALQIFFEKNPIPFYHSLLAAFKV